MKKLILILIGITSFAGVAYALPITTSQQNINPFVTSTYWLGTTTPVTLSWKGVVTDQLCLTADTCRTTWPSGGVGGSGTVSTSTNESSGFLSYWTSNSATPALLGKVATSSLGVIGPITFSGTIGSQVGGVGGNFGCTNASAGVTGCLTGTDWSTFNNKQATVSATWPITLVGAAVGFNGLSTSTAAVIGNIPYFSGVNTFANVATGTVTCTGTVSCAAGSYVVGSALTITGSGAGGSGTVSTSTNESPGQLAYWTSSSATPALLGKVATTSIGCGTYVTCTGFSALGAASTIALNGTLNANQLLYTNNAGTGLLSVATSSYAVSPGFSYSGTLGSLIGGAAGTLSQIEHRSFSYATSTAWTGTTTIPIETGYGEVWNSLVCFTDVGTVGVDFYHSTSHLNYIPTASTTNNTFAFSSNNTITSGDKTYVDIGTPASSPTKLNCSVKDTI